MAAQRQDVAVREPQQAPISAYERALIFGDISGLDERGRLEYLHGMCEASGLNPATRPFGYMEQWSPTGTKLVFYLTATGGAQLRTNHGISITRAEDGGEIPGPKGPSYRWTVYGRTADGREDVEIGSVPLYKAKAPHELLVGLDYENARKKCLTQAKTRLAKSLTGLAGVLSEDEVDGQPQIAQQAQPDKPTNGVGPALIDTELLPNRTEMREMADHLHELTGEEVTIPEMMTRKDARKLNALLIDLITQAEAAELAELHGEPVAAGAVRLEIQP